MINETSFRIYFIFFSLLSFDIFARSQSLTFSYVFISLSIARGIHVIYLKGICQKNRFMFSGAVRVFPDSRGCMTFFKGHPFNIVLRYLKPRFRVRKQTPQIAGKYLLRLPTVQSLNRCHHRIDSSRSQSVSFFIKRNDFTIFMTADKKS